MCEGVLCYMKNTLLSYNVSLFYFFFYMSMRRHLSIPYKIYQVGRNDFLIDHDIKMLLFYNEHCIGVRAKEKMKI